MCVPWESNPQPFALLTQCSTTEPHMNTVNITYYIALKLHINTIGSFYTNVHYSVPRLYINMTIEIHISVTIFYILK